MTDMTYPDGETLHYTYDDGGLLKTAWGEKAGNRYDYIKTLYYDEFGQRTHITYGNNTTTDYTYDDMTRRLATLVTALNASQGNRRIQNLSYSYDLVGNVKTLVNGINVATSTALPAGPVSQTFGYDDLYQLTTAQGAYSFGSGDQNTYTNALTYDSIGNITQKNQVNQIVQPSASTTLPKKTNYVLNYQYNFMVNGVLKPHAVSDDGTKLYTYDNNGNMLGWQSKTSGQTRTIAWNEENRVKQITDNGKTTTFLYDDTGERVIKNGQSGETVYINRFYSLKNGQLGTKHVFAGETRVVSKLEKNGTSTTTGTIPGSNGLNNGIGKKLGIIKRLPAGTTTTGITQPVEKDEFFYHGDHLGSSNMITDTYGAVYEHLEYFPYGETWVDEEGSSSNISGYLFTGKELDPETGLYYYGARYYDPVLSRWISADPIIAKYLPNRLDKTPERDLPGAGGIYDALNLNLYGYGHQNPVKYTDPDGKLALPWHFAITYVAARNSGKGFSESVSLAWKTMMVDLAEGSQKTDAEHTRMHAMAGTKPGGTYQTKTEALQATRDYVEKSIAEGHKPAALHAVEDLATPEHAGKEWHGFTFSPVPLSKDILDKGKVKEHFGAFLQTSEHIFEDVFPTTATVGNAYRNALDVLGGAFISCFWSRDTCY